MPSPLLASGKATDFTAEIDVKVALCYRVFVTVILFAVDMSSHLDVWQ